MTQRFTVNMNGNHGNFAELAVKRDRSEANQMYELQAAMG